MKFLIIIFLIFTVLALLLVIFPKISMTSSDQPIIDEEQFNEIVIPVIAHRINSGNIYTTGRNNDNIKERFRLANELLAPALIKLELIEIRDEKVDSAAIPNAIEGKSFLLPGAKGNLNAFFSGYLNQINGLALSQYGAVLVTDNTTVNDYRTLAHEFGHVFGLQHASDRNRLMARGTNGENLITEEISLARNNAKQILDILQNG